MRDRHKPRLCSNCTAPLGRQEDTCWKCGTPAAAPAPAAPALKAA
ncbi:MAG: hypothetical protein ACXVFN_11790 [Solirubrobacteraceae bacterium]